jgi:tetratricopeptide (TPR) repeat protein
VEGRFPVHARTSRQAVKLIAAALLLASPVASAVPKDGKARAAFDEGIAAYQKQDYAGAADAFGRSYKLEADLETLFAWAQAERQQDHCDKASELYEKLLAAKLPDENRRVVSEKLEECKKILAAAAPPPEPTPEDPKPMPEPPVDKGPEGKSRFKDPLGGVLLGTGVVGLAVGGYFLMSAKSADSDAKSATNYFEAERLSADAESKGRTGVIVAIAGGALMAASIVRYATIKPKRTTVTGWLSPDGSGGIAAFGRF